MSARNLPDDQLLSERRKYKKNYYNLQSSRNHLSFLQKCHNYQLTPKGLRLKISCVALASQETTIQQQFKNTIEKAERELINNLIGHYQQIETSYEEKLKSNIDKINEIKNSANPTTLYHHNKVFNSTTRNVENIIRKKQQITENKLDNLYFQRNKSRRPRESTANRLAQNNQPTNINTPTLATAIPLVQNNNQTTNISIPSTSAATTEIIPATPSVNISNARGATSVTRNNLDNSIVTNNITSLANSIITNTTSSASSTTVSSNSVANSLVSTTRPFDNIATTDSTLRSTSVTHSTANIPDASIHPRTNTSIHNNITTVMANSPMAIPRITPNTLTPVTSYYIHLDNSGTGVRPAPRIATTVGTPPPADHAYSIMTRSRSRQQQDFRL